MAINSLDKIYDDIYHAYIEANQPGRNSMARTYKTTAALIADAAKFGFSGPALVKSGAYHRTASGIYVADLSKAPKTYIL
jgi:hypothetical protein